MNETAETATESDGGNEALNCPLSEETVLVNGTGEGAEGICEEHGVVLKAKTRQEVVGWREVV